MRPKANLVGIRVFRVATRLMRSDSKRKLLLLLPIQIFLNALDVVAILLIGSLTVAGLDFSKTGRANFPQQFGYIPKFEDLSFYTKFIGVSAVSLFLLLTRTLLNIYLNRKVMQFIARQAAEASNQLTRKLFQSGPEFALTLNQQSVIYSLTIGVDNVFLNFYSGFIILCAEIVLAIVLFSSVLFYDFSLGILILLVFGCMFFVINRVTVKSLSKMGREYSDIIITNNTEIRDALSVIREITLRGECDFGPDYTRENRSKSLNVRAKMLYLPMLSRYLFELVIVLGSAIVVAIQLITSSVDSAIASFVIFLAASSRILPAVMRAQGALMTMRQSEGMSESTIDLIERIDELRIGNKVKADAIKKLVFKPVIELTNVSYSYPGSSFDSVSEVSCLIKEGQLVAIVGDSGAGKTTLMDLIIGMLSPKEGRITISGLEPREAISAWPGLVSYVPQDFHLMDTSIYSNVSLKKLGTESSRKRVREVLDEVELGDFLTSNEEFIERKLSNNGFMLSGGQNQRLAIARALYTDPRLILLDEATSLLDSATEKLLADAIYTNRGSNTVIVIAHRLSTVLRADIVMYMEKGRVIASGSFDQVRKTIPRFDQQAKILNL